MQITLEKIVWIALILAVVAVVGIYLMGVATTQSREVGQKAYVRLVSSNFVDDMDGSGNPGYVVTVRVVNSGEAGKNITLYDVYAVGFDPGTVESTIPEIGDGISIPPKGSLDLTVKIQSEYVAGTKSLVLDFDRDSVEFTISVPVP